MLPPRSIEDKGSRPVRRLPKGIGRVSRGGLLIETVQAGPNEVAFGAGVGCGVPSIPLHMHPLWRERYQLDDGQFPVATATRGMAPAKGLDPGPELASCPGWLELLGAGGRVGGGHCLGRCRRNRRRAAC